MPGATGALVLAVDFDATLVERGAPLRWRWRAKEFLQGCAAVGIRIWLLSCRCAPACHLADASPTGAWESEDFWESGRAPAAVEIAWQLFEEMRAFLLAEGVWHLVTPWTLPGKPLSDAIIDDKAEQPDFARLAAEMGVYLAPAYPAGVALPHAQPSGPATDVQGGGVAVPAGAPVAAVAPAPAADPVPTA